LSWAVRQGKLAFASVEGLSEAAGCLRLSAGEQGRAAGNGGCLNMALQGKRGWARERIHQSIPLSIAKHPQKVIF